MQKNGSPEFPYDDEYEEENRDWDDAPFRE